MRRRIDARSAVLGILAAAFIFAPRIAESHDCIAAVKTRLAELGVDSENVNGVRFFTRKSAGARAITGRSARKRITGYEAWVRFHSCSGNLVVNLNA